MGRKQNDVFVLGDESLATETIGGQNSDADGTRDGEGLTKKLPRLGSSGAGAAFAPASMAPRRMAVLGLGVGTAAVITCLILLLEAGGQESSLTPATSSSASPSSPVVKSAVVSPAPTPPQRSIVPQPKQERPQPRSLHRPHHEPERKPLPDSAPNRSTVDVPTPAVEAIPPTEYVPALAPESAPPPPPSASSSIPGDGASGGGEFGFER
jgi:hypothetical protein